MRTDEPDEMLRHALRDLVPGGYTSTADPLPRVVASVRRRRVRQRTLLAVSAVGAAAVLALAVPALVLPFTGGGGGDLRAGAPAGVTGQVPPPPAEPPVFPVAEGRVDGVDWATGSTSIGPGARRCLRSSDGFVPRGVVCFEGWKGDRVAWTATPEKAGAVTATRIVGVTPSEAVRVRVLLTDGRTVTVSAVRTRTELAGQFFALMATGRTGVRSVTLLDAADRPLGPPATDPGVPPCRPGPNVACAEKEK